MSLSSVLNTANTGISAAAFAFDVIANNMANVQTDGFKASRVTLTSGPTQTYSTGSAPNGSSGGTNPVQLGMGVQIAGVETNFQQGQIVLSGDPLDLAIEGDGFFALEGPGDEILYTRNGNFQLNANGEIVSATGGRLLGHPVDENFHVDQTRISPLTVPQGGDSPSTQLNRISVDYDGRLRGYFADGSTHELGQVMVTRFSNPAGLVARGNSVYSVGSNSGLPTDTGSNGAGVVAGARELSNAAIDDGLTDMMLYSTMFRANMRVFETASELMEELVHLRRW